MAEIKLPELHRLYCESIVRAAIYKGSDVRVESGILSIPAGSLRRSIEAGRWSWEVCLSYPQEVEVCLSSPRGVRAILCHAPSARTLCENTKRATCARRRARMAKPFQNNWC